MRLKVVLSLFLLFTSFHSFSQISAQVEQYGFNIIHSDKQIGTLIATKASDGLKTTYSDKTELQTHLFTKINVDFSYDVEYRANTFVNSTVLIHVNGHEHTKASTKKNNKTYQFFKDDDDEIDIKTPIKYSSVRLLFDEPVGIGSVFSEEDGSFHVLEELGDHIYQKTSPKGHKNKYHYEAGRLKKAEIHAGVISFDIEPAK